MNKFLDTLKAFNLQQETINKLIWNMAIFIAQETIRSTTIDEFAVHNLSTGELEFEPQKVNSELIEKLEELKFI